MTQEIRDPDSLRKWLQGKPIDWAQVIALRMALRVTPLLGEDVDRVETHLSVFHALSLVWGAHRWPNASIASIVENAASSVRDSRRPPLWGPRPEPIPRAVAAAAEAAACAADALHSGSYAIGAGLSARGAAVAAVVNAERAFPGPALWAELERDIADLAGRGAPMLFRTPLWRLSQPEVLEALWHRLLGTKRRSFRFWWDWYHRRIAGSDIAFLPNQEQDRALVYWLAEQDRSFWARDSRDVNDDITAFIERGLLPEAPSELESEPEPEPQNPLAPVFSGDFDGRIDLDAIAGNDAVQIGAEARDRHAEVHAVTQVAIGRCGGNSSAATREALETYQVALGAEIEEIRPSQLVQRGESLRQELAIRERADPDSNLPPIPDTALLALRAVVSAHNLLVGLDPALSRRDETRLGPDAVQAQVAPNDARGIAASAVRADILTAEACDAIETAARLAPAIPDPDSRRSRQLTETVRNFGRQAIAMLHAANAVSVRTSMVVTVVGSTAAASGGGGIIAAGGAASATAWACHKLGQWALKNEDWFRKTFAGNDTMLRVIDHVMNELRKLPLA